MGAVGLGLTLAEAVPSDRRLGALANVIGYRAADAFRQHTHGNQIASTPETPLPVDVTAGKSRFWCRCGQSVKQPFCDGSHKEECFEPMKVEADKTVFFCGCKPTGKAPPCDGSHSRL